jgi:hypothetical protein
MYRKISEKIVLAGVRASVIVPPRPLPAPAIARSIPISSGRHVKGKIEAELQSSLGVSSEVHHGPNPESASADPTGEGSPMKSFIAALALCFVLAASPAGAQVPSQSLSGGVAPNTMTGASARTPRDNSVIKSSSIAPNLTPANELRPPSMDLPREPVEPYLLTKENGPFMVLARVFRGPEAERMALALVKELRNQYHLPAYILRTKDYPGKSLMRGTPPTVPSSVMQPDIKMPEKIRTVDEAAVLVGNEKTLAGSEKLWQEVRKIRPDCLNKVSTPFHWREGLSKSYRTTNPYVPVQLLYPSHKDRLMVQMNSGLRSITNCPGRYSLQIAEFAGRSTYQLTSLQPTSNLFADVNQSPLRTAHADAERMADKLAKDAEFQRLGIPVYVVHDRTSSRVFVGSFDSPRDPRAFQVRDRLVAMAYPLADRSNAPGARGKNALDTMIVPALALSDISDIKSKIQK